jgi:hypothetical protein
MSIENFAKLRRSDILIARMIGKGQSSGGAAQNGNKISGIGLNP